MRLSLTYLKYAILAIYTIVLSSITDVNNIIAQDITDVLEVDKLTASTRNVRSRFGATVSVSGNYAIISSPTDSTDENGLNPLSNRGAAYIFRKNNMGQWEEVQKLVSSDRSKIVAYDSITVSHFGHSVFIDNGHAVVSAIGSILLNECFNQPTQVVVYYVYEIDGLGVWHEKQRIIKYTKKCTILHLTSQVYNAKDIVIRNNTLILGTSFNQSDNQDNNPIERAGAVHIYEKDTDGVWKQAQKITANDRKQHGGFGHCVDFNGAHLLIGAIYDNTDSNNFNPMVGAGSAYIFKKNTNGVWEQTQKITAPDRKSGVVFGNAVSISDKIAIIGSQRNNMDFENKDSLMWAGAAYILERDSTDTWKIVKKFTPTFRVSNGGAGFAVDNSDSLLVVSSPGDVPDSTYLNTMLRTGSVYFLKRDSVGDWKEWKRINASDAINSISTGAYGDFGVDVSLSDSTVFVGNFTEGYEKNGANYKGLAGAVYVYEFEYCLSSSEEITDTSCGQYTLNNETYTESGTYQQTIKNAKGCDSTITLHLTIMPPLEVNFMAPDTLCNGEELTVIAFPSGGIPNNYTYRWLFDGALIGTDSILTHAFTPLTPSNASLYLVLFDNCSNPNDTFSKEIIFRPKLDITLTVNNPCANPSATISAALQGGLPQEYLFQWFDESGNFLGEEQSLTVNPLGAKEYTAILSDGCSKADTATITIGSVPDIVVTATPDEGCEPLPVTFEIETIYPDGFTWNLNPGDGNNYNNLTQSQITLVFPTGTYFPMASITTDFGCSNNDDNIFFEVFPKPQAYFSFHPESPSLDSPFVSFTNLSTGAINYFWNIEPVGNFEDFEPNVTYPDTGHYHITLIAETDKGCLDTFTSSLRVLPQYHVYLPSAFSPNGDGLNDTFRPVVAGVAEMTFQIYNRWGETVFSGKNQETWDGNFKGKPVQEGIYVYSVQVLNMLGERQSFSGSLTVLR
jgi:gliding motility-associated-like protein